MIDLTGVRVLIAEDEFIIAYMLKSEVEACGAEVVGMFSRLSEVVEAAKTLEIDLALLDVKLRGEVISPAVQELEDRHIPILLHTGYSVHNMPPGLAHRPMIRKPHSGNDICEAIHKLHRRRRI